jgi:hypothetical protein
MACNQWLRVTSMAMAVLWGAAIVTAQGLAEAKPEQIGPSAAALARIDLEVEPFVERSGGIVLGVHGDRADTCGRPQRQRYAITRS